MKKILVEYSNIIAYTISGIVFGLAFFLLFLNFYHYEDVNDLYKKQDSDYQINNEIKEKINKTKENINSVNLNMMTPNYNNLSIIQTKLNVCIDQINNSKLDNILQKETISISDVYEMQQFYKIDIANECLVKQLYGLTTTDNSMFDGMPTFKSTIPFIENNINELKDSTDYVEKIIKNNSSYNFTSRSTKEDVYDQLKDSYYSVLHDYVNVVDFIYDISVLYINMAGGNI